MGLFDNLKKQAENLLKNEVNQATRSAVSSAKNAVKGAAGNAGSQAKTQKVTLSALPQDAASMQAMPEFDLSDPFAVAAFTVAALNRYPADREAAIAMLNALKGPEPLTPRETQFINDRFMDGKDYVTRSYFGGSSPENDYTPAVPYTVAVTEQSNSRQNEGYINLYLDSSGADSKRQVTLRYKASANQWFLWQFDSLLLDIRIPKSADKWA